MPAFRRSMPSEYYSRKAGYLHPNWHGGNIRETLVKFAQLIEERQLSALREYVNVLSGKMSVVMMVFLFPALLIFLAGPGFMALAKGLSGAL